MPVSPRVFRHPPNIRKKIVALSVILGVGNVLLTDDGAGVHVARALMPRLAARADVLVLDAGTLSFTLAPIIEDADRLIMLDAAQLNLPAGSIRCFLDAQVDQFLGRSRLSVHEIGLRDLMDIARLTERLPRQRALIGVQPAFLGWGTDLTPNVAAGVQAAAQVVLELLDAWPASGCGQIAAA
jgi:hydrogenase maturation protease